MAENSDPNSNCSKHLEIAQCPSPHPTFLVHVYDVVVMFLKKRHVRLISYHDEFLVFPSSVYTCAAVLFSTTVCGVFVCAFTLLRTWLAEIKLIDCTCRRYYAICHPLRARHVHTITRAQVLIAIIWVSSLVLVSPQLVVQRIEPILVWQPHREPAVRTVEVIRVMHEPGNSLYDQGRI